MWEPDYTILATAKNYLKISNDNENDLLALDITTASSDVNKHCKRQFGKLDAPVLLRYRAWYNRDDCRWTVNITDIYSTAGLVVTVDGTTVTEYDLLPDDAALRGRPWERITFRSNAERQPTGAPLEVGVFGLPGWASVPVSVTHATHLQMARLRFRRDSPSGVAGSPQAGGELRLLERYDADFVTDLKPFVRRWGAA